MIAMIMMEWMDERCMKAGSIGWEVIGVKDWLELLPNDFGQ
jgi:hypothetical protein